VNLGGDEEEEQEIGRQNENARQEEAQEDGQGLNNVAAGNIRDGVISGCPSQRVD
jgi:hypothetical protein